MLRIEGFFSDGKTSKTHDAILTYHQPGRLTVSSSSDNQDIFIANESCEVSTRLGGAPRVITFLSGATFTSADHGQVDILARETGNPLWHRILPVLEANLALALGGAAVAAVLIWFTLTQGIPGLAKFVAFNLPPSVEQNLGKGTLELLDKHVLLPSELPVAEQLRIKSKMEPLLGRDPELSPRLIFRKSGAGANAFALPSQTILFTDALVELAGNDEQLIAVLLHELGHLKHRHILRRSLQGSLITIASILVTGDVSGVNELIAGIPTLLIDASYSRDFEREADDYAIDLLLREGIPVKSFEEILQRLQAAQGEDRKGDDPSLVTDFLSSHPGTAERLSLIRSSSFQQQKPGSNP
ncbi:MAG: peptidase M48 Ste24p [Gammaproteobacteria bacterium]|jgi:Zn-dependent protease with chaperone function|nr:peptidase M48 Ste24p [Gammaproteobacteria bacterium]|tara:strand:- start:3872 stop:4939 length:1068 start_codon:yes stop_codon:yes gene_type:complete